MAKPTTSFLSDEKFRSVFFQALTLVLVVAFFWFIINNAINNMQRLGIANGFGFLGQSGGFDIGFSPILAYDPQMSNLRVYLVGLQNTIFVAAIGIFFTTIIGFIVGILRLSPNWLIAKMAYVYVEIFRNIPLVLQLIFWYTLLIVLPHPRSVEPIGGFYLSGWGVEAPAPIFQSGFDFVSAVFLLGVIATLILRMISKRRQNQTGKPLPMVKIGIGLIVVLPVLVFFAMGMPLGWEFPEWKRFNFKGGFRIPPELTAMLIGLSLYTASFIAEIVRAGILAVSKGQTEAASALGLPRKLTLRLVIVPQALRVIVPPLTSQYLNLTKNSSLAIAVGYPDLVSVFTGTALNQSGQAVEIMAMTMATYLVLSLLTSAFMNWYNKRIALTER